MAVAEARTDMTDHDVIALRLDGYGRISDVKGRGGESFISEAVQREQVEAWAKSRPGRVEILEWHMDADVSGGGLDRPGLNRVIERIEAGESGGVVVARLDRLSRAGVADALKLVERIHDAGGQVAAVDLGIDPTTPVGELMMTLMLALARMERRRIGETWDVAQRKAVERGIHISGVVPTGYRRRQDRGLEPDPEKAPAITEAFHMRASGKTYAHIARWLTEQGVTPTHGSPNWMVQSVRGMLANRVYLGEGRYGRYVNPEAHDPLVDRATWEAAQAIEPQSWVRSEQREALEPPLLTRLLRCAGCRYILKPDSVLLRGERVRQYRCRKHHSTGECPAPVAILGAPLEELVERRFLEAIGRRIAIPREVDNTDLAEKVEAVQRAEAALVEYRDSPEVLAAIGAKRFAEGLTKYQAEYDRAMREMLAARRDDEGGLPGPIEIAQAWPDMDVMTRRAMLTSVFDAIVVKRVIGEDDASWSLEDRLFFIGAGDLDPSEWPKPRGGRGRSDPWPPFVFD